MRTSGKNLRLVLAMLAGLTLVAVAFYWWRSRGGEGIPVHARYKVPSEMVSSLVFLPSGESLLVGELSGSVTAMDTTTWTESGKVDLDQGLSGLAISPNGHTLVTTGMQAKIWDVSKGIRELRLLHTIRGTANVSPQMVLISPDGSKLAVDWWGTESFSEVPHVIIYDLPSAKEVATLGKNTGSVFAMAFSHEGQTLMTNNTEGTRHWNVVTGRAIDESVLLEEDEFIRAFSHDGKRVAAMERSGVVIRDTITNAVQATLPHEQSNFDKYEFSPDGKKIAHLIQDPAPPRSPGSGFEKILRFFGRSSRPHMPCAIKLWNAESGQLMAYIPGLEDGLMRIAFSPDGEFLAAGGYTDTVLIWRVDDVLAAARIDDQQ